MENVIIIAVLIAIVGGAVWYIIKQKKNKKCIGCPYADNCNKKCH